MEMEKSRKRYLASPAVKAKKLPRMLPLGMESVSDPCLWMIQRSMSEEVRWYNQGERDMREESNGLAADRCDSPVAVGVEEADADAVAGGSDG